MAAREDGFGIDAVPLIADVLKRVREKGDGAAGRARHTAGRERREFSCVSAASTGRRLESLLPELF